VVNKLGGAAAIMLTVLGLSSGAAAAPAQETCDGPGVRAIVQDQITDESGNRSKEPIPDVTIVVTDPDGNEVGTGVTNELGQALICVPEKADYIVKVDESTLPDGKEIAGSPEVPITEVSFTTIVKTVSFFTGSADRNTLSFGEKLAQRLVDGTRLGLIIAITAVGLSLIFGTTGLTNFAHGEMVTWGGMMVYLFGVTIGMSLLIATPIAVVLGGLFGYLLDKVIFAPLRRRGTGLVAQMVVTVGLGIFLRNAFLFQFGGDVRFLPQYNAQAAWSIGPVDITPRDFTTMMLSLATVLAVALLLQRTRLGKATRAVSDNAELASATGIDSQRVIRLVWIVGAGLAALGGVFRGLDEGLTPDMGGSMLFLMFAAVTLGGLGSAYGALVGGVIVGILVETSTLFGVPTELKTVPGLFILVIVLLVRPQGILGRAQRVG
jgi:branched-chain amino acid transport system permease protein